jgi:hypothetical protein
MQQATTEAERFVKREALRAQPPEICGMISVANGDRFAAAVRPRLHAAADATIGARRSDGGREWDRSVHGQYTSVW